MDNNIINHVTSRSEETEDIGPCFSTNAILTRTLLLFSFPVFFLLPIINEFIRIDHNSELVNSTDFSMSNSIYLCIRLPADHVYVNVSTSMFLKCFQCADLSLAYMSPWLPVDHKHAQCKIILLSMLNYYVYVSIKLILNSRCIQCRNVST